MSYETYSQKAAAVLASARKLANRNIPGGGPSDRDLYRAEIAAQIGAAYAQLAGAAAQAQPPGDDVDDSID